MAGSRGLGKGLGALLGDAAMDRESSSDKLLLPLSQIEPCASQPRKSFDDEALADLADSIREHGIIQPLTVRKLASGYYQIIAGERRWRAARMAGLSEVPALVIEADDRKAMELALIENLQREDLNPLEEAEGYRSLIESFSLTQEEAAERVGKSRSAVANAMRLLSLCDEVRKMLVDGALSAGHARALLPLSVQKQKKAAEAVISSGLNVRQTEALVKKLSAEGETEKKERPTSEFSIYANIAAESLTTTLGRTVKIVEGRKKGRVELEYYGVDDLNDLLEALAALKKAKRGGDKQ
jgi:ParB family chromosome partitioning protein